MNKNKKITTVELKGSPWLSFLRGVQLGLTNLWRNKLLTGATVLVVAIMICIFNIILAVNFISQNALQNLNQKVDLVVYLKDSISTYDSSSMVEEIKQLPGVTKVEFISKEKALDIISKTYPETAEFLVKFNLNNPLPPSISIGTSNAENYQNIITHLENSRFKDFIDQSQENDERSDQNILSSTALNLININNFIKQLIFWVVFIFIIGSSLIVINAIQLTIFMRKSEVFIMRLVGATHNFIRLPFLVEGFAYALLAVTLSFIIFFLASQALGLETLGLLGEINQVDLPKIFVIELALTAILNLISSGTTVQHYLKSKLIIH
ncbi:MAG: cell division protein FtsX [Candidatus Altimarinota bacterium]